MSATVCAPIGAAGDGTKGGADCAGAATLSGGMSATVCAPAAAAGDGTGGGADGAGAATSSGGMSATVCNATGDEAPRDRSTTVGADDAADAGNSEFASMSETVRSSAGRTTRLVEDAAFGPSAATDSPGEAVGKSVGLTLISSALSS